MDLRKRHCVPCEGGVAPLARDVALRLLRDVPGWTLEENPAGGLMIARTFRFRDFRAAWAFCDRVASLAEAEGHHPEFLIRWNLVTLRLSTHAIGGLSDNDFIVAAKIEEFRPPHERDGEKEGGRP